MNLGARILQAGGVERAFRQIFGAREGEKLLKASQCYLSTTAGPIAGMLFISTEKIAFHSDRSLSATSPQGEVVRTPYKVILYLHEDLPHRSATPPPEGLSKFLDDPTGDYSAEEDQAGQPDREREQTFAEIHPDNHRGRVRVLVHGVRLLQQIRQVRAEGMLQQRPMSSRTRNLLFRQESSSSPEPIIVHEPLLNGGVFLYKFIEKSVKFMDLSFPPWGSTATFLCTCLPTGSSSSFSPLIPEQWFCRGRH